MWFLNKTILIKEYIKNKKSTYEIAKEIGCSSETIRRYLKKYNIKIRNISESLKGKYKGKKAPSWNKERHKKYYCKEKDCNNDICYDTWKIGSGLCRSCAMKKLFQNPKNHPSYIDGRTHEICYCKNYREKNKDKINEKHRKYYYKNMKKIKKQTKKYRQTHKEQIKKYRMKNKKKLQKYQKNHRQEINKNDRKRRKNDLNFKLACNLRRRVRSALKGNSKFTTMIKLVGCSIKQLKRHLQKKFKKGMTWKNYGFYGWHIDHIRPCASFDLRKLNEQQKCFHYINLQPLWAEENWSKNKK